VNLALKGLPQFKCLQAAQGQHNGTIHLLPQHDVISQLRQGFADAQSGVLPEFPTIEWYIHTPVDPSLQDRAGHHSSAFFVQWVPHTPAVRPAFMSMCSRGTAQHAGPLDAHMYRFLSLLCILTESADATHPCAVLVSCSLAYLAASTPTVQTLKIVLQGSTWEAEEAGYVQHLISIADRFAPGTSDLVADIFTLTPPKIESHFGITGGHIHHVDNSFGFDERFPYRVGVEGLYSCSAGCHPAGSVIGAAGHNASVVILQDLGLGVA
jgi:phytoene dehydrogenase-like protein